MTQRNNHIDSRTPHSRQLHLLALLAALLLPAMAWGQEPVVMTTDDNGNGIIDESEQRLYLIQALSFQSFHIAPQDNNTITTNNIFGDYLLWYFLDAEEANNVQYYYIVNKSTGKYIYNHNGNSRGISLISSAEFNALSNDNKEKCKFKLVVNNTNNTTGYYNIDVKANQTYFGLNKQSGSQTNTNPIRLTNNQYINDVNSKWKFIPFNGTFTWPNPPFTVSTDQDKHYYKIHNLQNAAYYVSTDATPDKVTYASTVTNSTVWYFKEAGSDTWFKYYYIVNPEADKYMYYSGTATNGNDQTDAVSVKTYDSNNEDRYQFVVVQTARGDGDGRVECYAIIPKLLTGFLWGSNSIGPKGTIADGLAMGIINSRGESNTAQWQFETSAYPLICVAPTITYSSATGEITIASTTPGSTLYYTTDETTPSSSNGNLYNGPFTVSAATTIKAIATKSGCDDSEVTTKTYSQVATPSIQDNGANAISITCDTEGATIHYTTDGSTPNTSSSVYSSPLTENVSNVTINAIAVKEDMINSAMASGTVMLQCAKPIISRVGSNASISCSFPTSGVSIYYTINGGTPTSTSTLFSGSFSVAIGDVIKAIAIATNYNNSEVAEKTIREELTPTGGIYYIDNDDDFSAFIDMASENAGATYHYELRANVSAGASITQPFSGIFDGGGYTITGLTQPLFNTVNGGTVKNTVLDNVTVTGSGNVGALCNEATGATKIYNCGILSGSVRGGTNTGGLVGLIESGSSVRVVNCYNFADVSGSSYAAGIVGKNEGTVSSDGTVGNVRIALCMMYGNVTDATNISPVYGGNHANNVANFTEYNYWRYHSGLQYTELNDQLPVREDEYLTRFPFYRHILNSHRELAAMFLFGGASCNNMSTITADDIAEIGHWAFKKEVAAYPIIEPWPTNTHTTPTSTHNNLPSTTDDYAGKLLTEMGTNGYLAVSVKIGANTYSVSLPITDMDTLNYDFTWGKVVLPFANEFEVNTDYSKICTGWKITGVTNGTPGTFSNYNVSDRNCTNKDLYATTGFIFAQGGNYIVPYGVTGIEITANFATAYYLRDENYEIAYSGNATGDNSGYTGRTGLAGTTSGSYNGQTVYNTLNSVLGQMAASGSVHEQAVVLVGNYHWDGAAIGNDLLKRGFTFMSIDADNNQEPDYALYSNNTLNRPSIPPTRFDFLAIIPLGMSSYLHGSVFYPNIPIWKPYGWFEITETGLTRTDQFEIDSKNFNTSESDTRNYRCIINGGYFTQMVRSYQGACNKLKYYQIGGNAYVKEFYPGNHSIRTYANPLVPINVTGGEIEQCFMTGYGKGTAYGTDIYFWCAGGRIHKFLGAYMEPPVQTASSNSNNPGTVNMTARIDHARIYRFFGGGTTSKARITGNINVTIDNSLVDFYCGGPEFGDMVTGENGKTVTTTADHTTFREYYGAGFGGTAITYTNDEDLTSSFNSVGASSIIANGLSYPSNFFSTRYLNGAADVGRLDYKDGYGIGNCYKYEYIIHSRGNAAVARFYTGYAMFSLAKAGSVTNTLTHCTVEGSFYGAGCQGTVDGTVTSTLTDCTILQSAFGGGYKAESNEVKVYTATQASPLSVYHGESGVFSDFGPIPTPDTYTWEQGTAAQNNVADETNHKLYTGTNVTLTDLGNVTGAITLTLDGHTVVSHNVFGGGNESKSLNNATVSIKGTSEVTGNVFGGGNKAAVSQNTTVNLQQGTTVLGNVYGGGNEGLVGGNSEVKIQDPEP